MTSATTPKHPGGRPRKPKSKPPTVGTDDGLVNELRAVVNMAVVAMKAKMIELTTPDPATDKLPEDNVNRAAKLAIEAGVLIGHIRRLDESLRNAARRLTVPIVTLWLRELSPDARAQMIGELVDDGVRPNVLS